MIARRGFFNFSCKMSKSLSVISFTDNSLTNFFFKRLCICKSKFLLFSLGKTIPKDASVKSSKRIFNWESLSKFASVSENSFNARFFNL